jgi:hypothetical protein
MSLFKAWKLYVEKYSHQVSEHNEMQIQMPAFCLFPLHSEDNKMPTFQHTAHLRISLYCLLNHGFNFQVCYSAIFSDFLSLEASYHLWVYDV